MRKGLSPTFTSGKIKAMMAPMGEVIDNMINHLEKITEKNSTIDMKPVFQAMALDVIAKCAFGIETNSFNEGENSELLTNAKIVFESFRPQSYFMDFMFFLFSSVKGIENYIPVLDLKGMEKLFRISKSIQDKREQTGSMGGDFMDHLVEIKKRVKAGELPSLSEEQVTGQGIIFFAAGYETTSSTLGAMCYHLVKNPEVWFFKVR